MKDYSGLVRGYVSKSAVLWDFPQEKMGIADKSLLRRIVIKNAETFEKHNAPLGSNAFATAVKREMLTWGYRSNIRSECYSYTLQFKRPLNGD